jgi:hypothetical protein
MEIELLGRDEKKLQNLKKNEDNSNIIQVEEDQNKSNREIEMI